MAEQIHKEKPREYATIVRIMQTDIPGNKKILVGLTYIKGISWATSNALCKKLQLDPNKRVSELDENEINQISEFLKNPQFPDFLINRRNDFETGENSHLITSNLEMKKEFDIR